MGHDLQAANQKVARLQNSLQVLQSKLQEREHQVPKLHKSQTSPLHLACLCADAYACAYLEL